MRWPLFALLLLAGMALAQQATEPATSPPPAAAETPVPAPQQTAPPARSATAPYLPSEEISEDLSVSFPVDI